MITDFARAEGYELVDIVEDPGVSILMPGG
jgi:hypothetical protein